jgi:protein-disulfide isomerase
MTRLKVSISKNEHMRGPSDAPISLVEYGDFQCPFSAAAHQNLNEVGLELGDYFQLIFRHSPLTQIHEYALLAALSAEAAGVQGKFWEMHDTIYDNQELLGPEGVDEFAEELDLDMSLFRESLKDKKLADRIKQDFMGGVRSGVNGTPAFFLNGQKFEGPLDVGFFRRLIKAA